MHINPFGAFNKNSVVFGHSIIFDMESYIHIILVALANIHPICNGQQQPPYAVIPGYPPPYGNEIVVALALKF